MNQLSRYLAFALWLSLVVVCGWLALDIRPDPSLRAVIPQGDHQLDREVAFFEQRTASQILALEAEAAPGDAEEAVRVLREAALLLESAGARPQAPPSPAAALRLAERVHQHLPALATPALLAEVAESLERERLVERLRELRAFLLEPGNEIYAPQIYRDLLGIEGRVLEDVTGELMKVAANATEDGILRHPDGVHAALVLQVDHPPADAEASRELMSRIAELAGPAADRGVTLRAIGAYRHFDDNYRQVWRDLAITVPISLILIMAVLYSLFRRERDLLSLHMPAVAGIAGGLAGVVLILGEVVPLMALGFGAGMLGITVDYGIHMVRACRDGVHRQIRRPLVFSFATAASAFAVLLLSDVQALRTLAVFVCCGLAAAVVTAAAVLPRMLRRRQQRDPWRSVSDTLVAWSSTRRWWGLALAVIVTAALVPGLLRLQVVTDPQRLDGSSPETLADLRAFSERWGLLSGSNFLVAEAAELPRAMGDLVATKRAAGLAPGMPDLLLPSPSEQAARIEAWSVFWAEHLDELERDLATATRTVGLRASAFGASFDSYGRREAPTIDRATWADTPLRTQLDELVRRTETGWQVISPIGPEAVDRVLALGTDGAEHRAWPASRRLLGLHLVDAMAAELRRLGLLIAAAMVLVLFALLRKPRRVAAVVAAPLVALSWTFGAFGYLGLELSAIHVLVATFVAGIGIDDAIFLSRTELRGHAMSPILATTATSMAGVGAMAFAGHPMVQSVGIAIFIGMACCLLACLLVCPAFDRKRDRPTIKTVDLGQSPMGQLGNGRRP